MRVKDFSLWLVSEAVNIQLRKEYHDGEEAKLFLRWVKFFCKHLNKTEKQILERYLPSIKVNIEQLYDSIEQKDIKEALKEINGNGKNKS